VYIAAMWLENDDCFQAVHKQRLGVGGHKRSEA